MQKNTSFHTDTNVLESSPNSPALSLQSETQLKLKARGRKSPTLGRQTLYFSPASIQLILNPSCMLCLQGTLKNGSWV